MQHPDFRVAVSVDEYVKSKLRPIEVPKGYLSNTKEISDGMLTNVKGVNGGLGWLASTGRPDMAAPHSIIPSGYDRRSPQLISEVNAAVKQCHAVPITITIWPIPFAELHWTTFTDSGFDSADVVEIISNSGRRWVWRVVEGMEAWRHWARAWTIVAARRPACGTESPKRTPCFVRRRPCSAIPNWRSRGVVTPSTRRVKNHSQPRLQTLAMRRVRTAAWQMVSCPSDAKGRRYWKESVTWRCDEMWRDEYIKLSKEDYRNSTQWKRPLPGRPNYWDRVS